MIDTTLPDLVFGATTFGLAAAAGVLVTHTKASERIERAVNAMGTSIGFSTTSGGSTSTPLVPAFCKASPTDWMCGAPAVSVERRMLAQAIREQLASDDDVIRLGTTDAERAADALDGF